MQYKARWFYILVVFIACLSFFAAETFAAPRKNVVILNSYNYGNPFSDDETTGILQVLNQSGLDPALNVEYMDWKKNPDVRRLNFLYEDYRLKFNGKTDLLVAQDDAALQFALKNRKEIFNDAPIVFCGINEASEKLILHGQRRITGVIEDCDPQGTLDAALKINPAIKKIYVIHDNTETGLATAEMTFEAVAKADLNLEVYPLNNLTNEELYEKVRHLPADSIILYTAYYTDYSGNTITSNEICQKVSEYANVPVYHLYDFALGYGIVGGSLLTGQKHGQAAGRMALKILQGNPIESLPVSHEKTTQLIFDYNELQRFNIPLDRLPLNSTVINKPFSFYNTYKNLVIGVSGFFTVLLVFIFLLLINIKKRRATERVLKDANDELNLLYEEIAASEEELRSNYHELTEKQVALTTSEERYALAVNGANDVVWDYDIQADRLYVSERICDILGLGNDKLGNLDQFKELLYAEDRTLLCGRILARAAKKPSFQAEVRLKCKNGLYRWTLIRGTMLLNAQQKPERMAGSLTDISERKNNEQAMQYMAYHDMLTGLINRSALYNEFSALRSNDTAAMIFLDLDNFKNINDTMGHSYGDRVLIEVGKRLKSLARKNIAVARFGGDEFVILHINYRNRELLHQYVRLIVRTIQEPFYMDGKLIKLQASMGIACYPEDGTTFDEICRNADTAMYDAKNKGRMQFSFFNRVMNERLFYKLNMENDLREALQKDEFILQYQPQVNVTTGEICGLEALVRWVKPGTGMVSPGEFIPLCEETGLIIPLGRLVLEKALAFGAQLKAKNIEMCISINVSVIQFNQPDFVPMVLSAITSAGVNEKNIGIELTETIFMDNFEESVIKINQLRNKGVQIFLDDFGTGFSSLKYLKNLPIDKLKVDKIFIDDIAKREDNITETVIVLAHKMGMKVVAEGVEQKEQLTLLQEYNCDMIQGYYISKPVFEKEIFEVMEKKGNILLPS